MVPPDTPHATPRISVILPTYNRAHSLRPAIDSVLAQDYADFELIVIDDASRDGTAEMVRALRDPRIRLLRHEKNRGAAGARNTGIAAARGELVAFQDSDDEWLPSRLTLQVTLLDRLPPEFGMVTGTILRPQADGSTYRGEWAQVAGADGIREVTFDGIARQFWAHLQSLLVRRRALAAAGPFDERLHGPEDWDLMLRLARVCRIADCGEAVAVLRYSADSLTHRYDRTAPAYELILEKFSRELAPDVQAMLARMTATRYCLGGQPQRAASLLRRTLELQPDNRGARWLLRLIRVAPWAAAPTVQLVRRLRA